MKVMSVFGTRPEAIKMAPVVHALAHAPGIEARVCVTGQHRSMLDQVLDVFGIAPDIDLNVMQANQSLFDVTEKVMRGMERVLTEDAPDLVLVHGDTTSAMAAALACFYKQVPVGHVEAGLRSGDMQHPWPEEMNRRFVDEVSALHFAPTAKAREALLSVGCSEHGIEVTGNTVIDALLWMRDRICSDRSLAESLSRRFDFLDPGRRLILVTSHRRENFGAGMERLCAALDLIAQRDDVQVVFPVHMNENVREPVHRIIGGSGNVHLIEPQDYAPFVYLLNRCDFVISDSGGIQEEAPALGKPVLVTRDVTERPEAVEAGSAKLVGTDIDRILSATGRLLTDPEEYRRMSRARSPFGDGQAAGRIVARLSATDAGRAARRQPHVVPPVPVFPRKPEEHLTTV